MSYDYVTPPGNKYRMKNIKNGVFHEQGGEIYFTGDYTLRGYKVIVG